MPDVVSQTLVNAAAEGIGCGDFALDNLQSGDQVKLLCPIGDPSRSQNRIAIWVRVTEINRHPLPDRQLMAGVVDQVMDLGEAGLEAGQTIRFARCNIVEVA